MKFLVFLTILLFLNNEVNAVIVKDQKSLSNEKFYMNVPGVNYLSHGFDVYGGVSSASRIFEFTYDEFNAEASQDFSSSYTKAVIIDGVVYRTPDQVELTGPLSRCTTGQSATPYFVNSADQLDKLMRNFRSYPGSNLFESPGDGNNILVLSNDGIMSDYLADSKRNYTEAFVRHWSASEYQTFLKFDSALSPEFISAVKALDNSVSGCAADLSSDTDVNVYQQILWETADVSQDACCTECLLNFECSHFLFDTENNYCWTFNKVFSTKPKTNFKLGALSNSTANVEYALVKKFFKLWGTHFVNQGILGGEITQLMTLEEGSVTETNKEDLEGYLQESFSMIERSWTIDPVNFEQRVAQSNHHIYPTYINGGILSNELKEWCTSIETKPALIRYSLMPIITLFDAIPGLANRDYLKILFNNIQKGRCVCKVSETCDIDTGTCRPSA